MGLEWIVLAAAVGFEAVLVLIITLPLPESVLKYVINVYKRLLRPMLAILPFALFQMLDVYWKYEHRIKCGHECTTMERDRFEKITHKSHRNGILALCAAFLYWMLVRCVFNVNELMRLEARVTSSKVA